LKVLDSTYNFWCTDFVILPKFVSDPVPQLRHSIAMAIDVNHRKIPTKRWEEQIKITAVAAPVRAP